MRDTPTLSWRAGLLPPRLQRSRPQAPRPILAPGDPEIFPVTTVKLILLMTAMTSNFFGIRGSGSKSDQSPGTNFEHTEPQAFRQFF